MNDASKNDEKGGNGATLASRPMWMDQRRQEAWDKVKQTVVADFHKTQKGVQALDGKIADKALEFGHAARDAFDKLGEWSDEVENKIKADWATFVSDANQSWDKVKSAVEQGYQRPKSVTKA